MKEQRALRLVPLFLVGIVLGMSAWKGRCATNSFVVTITDDSGSGSLREAMLSANALGGGTITFSNVTGTIALQSPLPVLTANTTIIGPGTNLLTVSGGNSVQVFTMNAGTTNSLFDLTIADGLLTNYPVLHPLPSIINYVHGAGISNAGSLMLSNCIIQDCAISTVVDADYGAGICNSGDLMMQHCEIINCTNFGPPASVGIGGNGGGIANLGNLTMQDCVVSGCFGRYGGGIINSSNLFLTNCIIVSCNCSHECDGGGICSGANLTVDSCIISNCSAFWGGGIESSSWGNLSIKNSTVVGNSAEIGGGLMLGGTNVLVGCSISGNSASFVGGGICNNFSLAEVTLINCTVSGNVNLSFATAGIAGDADMINCTIVSNTATAYDRWSTGGGVSGHIRALNCIFAGNVSNDINGVLISDGYNLLQNTNRCTITNNETGNIYGAAPLLGPLQDNGGPTWTHALLPGSPAIDAGTAVGAPTVDQRGVTRPQGTAPDIGAYEYNTVTPAFTKIGVQPDSNYWLEFSGLPAASYTLQDSVDLLNWSDVTTVVMKQNALYDYTNGPVSGDPVRFYRLKYDGP